MSRDKFVTGVGWGDNGTQWLKVTDAAKHPTMERTVPTKKDNYPTPNFNSAKVEKLIYN